MERLPLDVIKGVDIDIDEVVKNVRHTHKPCTPSCPLSIPVQGSTVYLESEDAVQCRDMLASRRILPYAHYGLRVQRA